MIADLQHKGPDKKAQGHKGTERFNAAICIDIFVLRQAMPQVNYYRKLLPVLITLMLNFFPGQTLM